jgi:hypothetical protein
MQAHDHHFPITAIYKMNPSPPAFSRLQAMATAEIYIVGWFCGGHGPHPSGTHGGLWHHPLEIHSLSKNYDSTTILL